MPGEANRDEAYCSISWTSRRTLEWETISEEEALESPQFSLCNEDCCPLPVYTIEDGPNVNRSNA